MLRVVMTGATGFIGQRLCARLSRIDEFRVTSLGRRASNVVGVDNIVVSSFDRSALRQALSEREFDILIHLAAAGVYPADRDLSVLLETNATLPAHLLELTTQCGVRAAVLAGSSAEYEAGPHCQDPLRESAPLEMRKLYGATKAAGSLLALSTAARINLSAAHLRFFNVYGPGEAKHRLLPSLVTSLRHKRRAALSLGMQIRDFIYVDDVCAAIMQVMERLLINTAATQDVFNVCTGVGYSVAQFARTVAAGMECSADLLDFGAVPMRPDEISHLVGDHSAVTDFCGWRPQTDLVEGVQHSIVETLDVDAND
jgi:nucleoside-diphosphate-sugar epimerase